MLLGKVALGNSSLGSSLQVAAAGPVTLCETEQANKISWVECAGLTADSWILLILPGYFGRSIMVVTGSLLS